MKLTAALILFPLFCICQPAQVSRNYVYASVLTILIAVMCSSCCDKKPTYDSSQTCIDGLNFMQSEIDKRDKQIRHLESQRINDTDTFVLGKCKFVMVTQTYGGYLQIYMKGISGNDGELIITKAPKK